MKLTPVSEIAEVEGSDLVYRGATLIVARANNKNFKRMFREVLKPHKKEFEDGRMDDNVAEDLMNGCIAKTILVGWSSFKDVTGKEWKYTVQNAEALLKDDRDAFEAITEFSENIDNYIIEQEQEVKEKLSA